MITNFLIYEVAQPILEEYSQSVALRMLLEKHEDEFPEYFIDCMVEAAELCLEETDPQFLYVSYVSAVVQMRMDIKELQEQDSLTTFSF